MVVPGFTNLADIEWSYQSLESMSVLEFFEILKLRIDVFVVEQNCAYAELDNDDKAVGTLHVQGRLKSSGQLVACARIITDQVNVEEAATGSVTKESVIKENVIKIGRVAVIADLRGQGVARELMSQVLAYIGSEFEKPEVQLSAQTYIESFYQTLGFRSVSGEYLEDGIPHVDMVLQEMVLQ